MPKPPAPPPEFFVDRSRGRHIVADAIRAQGYVVHAMADERGWVVLTKDERITRRADEQAALASSQLRVFALGTQGMTGPEMAERYAANINRMVQRSRKPGPFVDIDYPDRVERRWPK